jgi:hypothetical protein
MSCAVRILWVAAIFFKAIQKASSRLTLVRRPSISIDRLLISARSNRCMKYPWVSYALRSPAGIRSRSLMMEYSEFPAPNIEVTTKRLTGCSCDKKIAAVAKRRHRKTPGEGFPRLGGSIVPVSCQIVSQVSSRGAGDLCPFPAADAFGDLKSLNSNATV